MTDPKQWHDVKSVFQAALARPAGKRMQYVDAHCADESMRAEALRLLRLHEETGGAPGFLDSPIRTAASAPVGTDPLIGQTIEGFRILRRIGVGGMGAVYEAEQRQPQRRAAIKVIRPGFATRSTLRRLEYESEILAKLHHPGIAHVYAAGTFDLGDGAQPWLAMEMIDGAPLNEFLRDHPQPLRRKLELMLLLCEAVQHAHQRGVVHRDLKPSNILVVDDERITILDFGVARVIDADKQMTMHTAVGEIVGTLNYMSPEQLAGNPDDVDARCDVYALGVIGYEMLAGHLPHGAASSSVVDIVRAIEHNEPKRLGLVAPACRGDLETIFAKALEKMRQRRYQSAAEFAADLQRYLRNEAVLARPATALYQCRQFAKRHRALVGGVITTILALTVGIVLYAMEARAAHREAQRSQYQADKATAINNFMTNDFLMKVLAAANAQQPGERIPVEELVDQAAAQIGPMHDGDPLAEAAVRNEIATVYYNLGAFAKSGTQFARALALWEGNLGPDHEDTLKAVNNLGQALARQGKDGEAELMYRRALDGRLRVLGEENRYTLATMNNLANLLRWTNRLDEAETLFRRTLDIQRRIDGLQDKHTLITMSNLATLLNDRGKHDEALVMHREAYQSCVATLGVDHVTTLMVARRLGDGLRLDAKADEAERLLRDVLGTVETTLGSAHEDTLLARQALARVYLAQDRPADAYALLEQALSDARTNSSLSEKVLHDLQVDLANIERTMSTPTGTP